MKSEVLTNILDLIAFFMVTVDLYGRERLTLLAQRLHEVKMPSINPRNWWVGRDSTTGRSRFAVILRRVLVVTLLVALAAVLLVGLGYYFGGDEHGQHKGWDAVSGILFDRNFLSGLAWVAAAIGVAWVLLQFLIWLVFSTVRAAIIFILRVYNIDGVLIVCGAILFAISRLVAIYFAI